MPSHILGEYPSQLPGGQFSLALLNFLAKNSISAIPENLSFEGWTLNKKAGQCQQDVDAAAYSGTKHTVLEAQIRWLTTEIQHLETRDVNVAQQIAFCTQNSPDTLVVAVRGAHHDPSLSRQLKSMDIAFGKYLPPSFGLLPGEAVLQDATL